MFKYKSIKILFIYLFIFLYYIKMEPPTSNNGINAIKRG